MLRRAFVTTVLALAWVAPATAGPDATPSPDAIDAPASDASLSGDEIYHRVQRNRLHAYVQHARLVSGDRGENDQEMRIRVTWKSYRDDRDQPIRGAWSKTLIRYDEPFDVRFTSYLIVDNADRVNDQFIYLPTRRRVRRVNLRGESLLGTDFSFEDVVPREAEGASHKRLPDEPHEGIPCFVIDAIPKPEVRSEYSRFQLYVEKEHYVPLRTRYWDSAGIEVKELRADPKSIERFEDAWIPMRARMRHMIHETWTSIDTEKLEANPALDETVFEVRRLESH